MPTYNFTPVRKECAIVQYTVSGNIYRVLLQIFARQQLNKLQHNLQLNVRPHPVRLEKRLFAECCWSYVNIFI